jgi:hypothetical protein
MRWILEIDPDYTLRPEPQAMLPALRKIARVARRPLIDMII